MWIKAFFTLFSVAVCHGLEADEACVLGSHLVLDKNKSLVISSPIDDSTGTYPPSSLCSWTVTNTEKGKAVEATFELMSIWPTYNCAFDGVIVFDGNSTAETILGHYCNVGVPSKTLVTSGSSIHILFYSGDFSQSRFRGFHLRLTSYDIPVPCDEKKEITCHNGKCIDKTLVCNYIDDCGDGTDEENCGHTVKGWLPCGKTPISPVLGNGDRIVGGQPAVPGSWPWQVSLRKKGSKPYQHLCGAVILNDLWLLSAAHCFRGLRNASLWSAHLGKHFKERDEDSEQTRYLREIIIHPEYVGDSTTPEKASKKENDIALLRLNAPVMMKRHIQPICLPPWRLSVTVGTRCHVTGWGSTLEGPAWSKTVLPPMLSLLEGSEALVTGTTVVEQMWLLQRGTGNHHLLKQAEVPIVSNEMCKTSYAGKFNVTDAMICAGFLKGGHDSCKGDSGGPLVVNRYERWYLIGIVSTGGSCAEAMQPGVYTRVPSFYWWITRTLSRRRG